MELCTNFADKIWGKFDSPLPLRRHFHIITVINFEYPLPSHVNVVCTRPLTYSPVPTSWTWIDTIKGHESKILKCPKQKYLNANVYKIKILI